MNIQEEIRKWADKTAKGYVSIANEYGEDAPGFYTQSDLTKIVTSPEVVVLGINPGSGGTYISQKGNPNWGLNGMDMNGEHLIQRSWGRFRSQDHGVGSSDHFQEPVILIMIHCCLNSHVICLDK